MNTKFLFNKIVIFLEKYLNIFLSRLLVINKILFPYLIILTYFFLFLESYTYIGFLRKFILVDSRFFLVLSIISVSLIFYLKHTQRYYKSSFLESLVVNLNIVLFLPFVVLYFIMIVANAINYPNYVFANYHIQPQNFVNLVYLSLVLLVLKFDLPIGIDLLANFLGDVVKKTYFFSKQSIFLFAIIFLLVFYFVDNLVKTSNRAINDLVFIATHLDYDYDDKMRHVWGFYYDYMQFVKRCTPEDSTILIPPQSYHWLSSGNGGLNRYFLYPRKQIQEKDVFEMPAGGYDYIMISRGEWDADGVDWGWPKVYIKAEKIWYVDPKTLEVNEFYKDFDPSDSFNKDAWGLIKVKKDI